VSEPRQRDVFASRAQRLVAERTGLLIIDAQNWVMDEANRQPRPEFYEGARAVAIPNMALLIDASRKSGVEVIYTVMENYTADGRDRSLDYKLSNFFIPKGSHDAQVIAELAPGTDEMVIPKTSSSSIQRTSNILCAISVSTRSSRPASSPTSAWITRSVMVLIADST
jgi:nicotinamidase-related amidase